MLFFYRLISKPNKVLMKYIPLIAFSMIFSLPSWAMEKEEGEEKVQTFYRSNAFPEGKKEKGKEKEEHFASGRKKIRILTIDGGGVRGIIPATILEKMEEILQSKCGKEARLAPCFDLMAGTSTGAIIVLGLNASDQDNEGHPNQARKLSNLYLKEGATIFPPLSKFKKVKSLAKPKYDPAPLEKVLAENLGGTWLSESKTHVLVPAFDMGQDLAYLFDSHEAAKLPSQDFKMRDIARATSAAPTYFKAAEIGDRNEDIHTFTDGGTYANDPTFEAIQKAEKLFPGCDLFIVSLGTGETPRKFGDSSLKKAGQLQWAGQIPGHLMGNAQDRHLQYLDHLMGKMTEEGRQVDYYRIQLTIDRSISEMDREENIPSLRQAGLYITNSLNRGEYKNFKKIVREIKHSYKEKGLNLL